jgi:hypothetical protein
MNVKGNYTVTVLWLLNSNVKDFEAALPKPMQKELEKARTNQGLGKALEDLNPLDATSLASFPLVSTFAMNWSPELVTLVSQQASWTVYQARKEIESLLKAAK